MQSTKKTVYFSDPLASYISSCSFNTAPFREYDARLYDLVQGERNTRDSGLCMTSNVSQTFLSVDQCDRRLFAAENNEEKFYARSHYIDEIERLAELRTLNAYGLDANKWRCSIRSVDDESHHSVAVRLQLLKSGDRTMSFNLPKDSVCGDNTTTLFYDSLPSSASTVNSVVDYNYIDRTARIYRPKVLIIGATSFGRNNSYKTFAEIARRVDANMMVDITNVAPLLTARVLPSPFDDRLNVAAVVQTMYSDICGKQCLVVLYRRDLSDRPMPTTMRLNEKLTHAVALVASQMRQVHEQVEHYRQAVLNAQSLSTALQQRNLRVVTGTTDTHTLTVDLVPMHLYAQTTTRLLSFFGISCTPTALPNDRYSNNLQHQRGLRFGLLGLTLRGLCDHDEIQVLADLIERAIVLMSKLTSYCCDRQLRLNATISALLNGEWRAIESTELMDDLHQLRSEVRDYAFALDTWNEEDDDATMSSAMSSELSSEEEEESNGEEEEKNDSSDTVPSTCSIV